MSGGRRPSGRLGRGLCYFAAFYLSLWCLQLTFPGVGFSVVKVATFLFFSASVLLFANRTVFLSHFHLFVAFVAMHFVVVNPFGDFVRAASLMLHIAPAFVFFVILINLVDDLEHYSKVVLVLIGTTAVICAALVYLHLFVFNSDYLTAHLTAEELFWKGRGGKNTLAFFLALVFPFAYSRFSHRRSLSSLLCVALIGFSAVYTVSRMALVSVALSTVLFAIVAVHRKRFIGQTVAVGVVFAILSLGFGVRPVQEFLKLRSPVQVEEVESGERGFVSFEGQRVDLARQAVAGFLRSPLFGYGSMSFREGQRSESHNDYVRLMYEFGGVGLILFLSIFVVSYRDLRACRKSTPAGYEWLVDAQTVAVLNTAALLLAINAYETLPVWFVLAGAQIVRRGCYASAPQREFAATTAEALAT